MKEKGIPPEVENILFSDGISQIDLSEAESVAASKFARRCVKTVDYKNQSPDKVRKDIYIGKLGEEAVAIVLQTLGVDVVGPDYTIYDSLDKSWDSDLYISDVGIAVKTQSIEMARKYELSWTFSVNDPILNDKEAIVAFVMLDGLTAYVFPLKRIKDLHFRDPVLEYLHGIKKVVYQKEM